MRMYTAKEMQEARAEGFVLGQRNFAADLIKKWAEYERGDGSDLLHDRLMTSILARVLHTDTTLDEIADGLYDMTQEYYHDTTENAKHFFLGRVHEAVRDNLTKEQLLQFITDMKNE